MCLSIQPMETHGNTARRLPFCLFLNLVYKLVQY